MQKLTLNFDRMLDIVWKNHWRIQPFIPRLELGYFDPFMSNETKTLFLFSLSHNCKFELQMKEEAIKRNEKNEAICFGDE